MLVLSPITRALRPASRSHSEASGAPSPKLNAQLALARQSIRSVRRPFVARATMPLLGDAHQGVVRPFAAGARPPRWNPFGSVPYSVSIDRLVRRVEEKY